MDKLNLLLKSIMRISQCHNKSLDEGDYKNAVKNLLGAVIGHNIENDEFEEEDMNENTN